MALKFRCRDAGVVCGKVTKAADKDGLLAKLADHAQKAHGVELNQTLVDYAVTRVKDTGE